MKIRVIRGHELEAGLIARWHALQDSVSALRSPFFAPEFTQCVAAVRDDVFIAVLEADGAIVGFFPYQRSRFGVGRPAGGLMSDYHGVVSHGVAWEPTELLRACRLSSWQFHHLPENQGPAVAAASQSAPSYLMDLRQGFAGYEATIKERGSNLVKQTRKHMRQLEKRCGPLRFEMCTTDKAALDQLLAWKSAQYLRSDMIDVFSRTWSRALLDRIWATQTPHLRGVLSALYVGDELAAVHFGMQSRTTWHWWFPSHDQQFEKYGPGIILRLHAAETAEALGLCELDLGKGDTAHKPRLATDTVTLHEGRLERPGLSTAVRRFGIWLEHTLKQGPLRPIFLGPGRLLKRLERARRFS
jgi:CelD/BcsL family acetyltransferase involved in cellulose biosynthesis